MNGFSAYERDSTELPGPFHLRIQEVCKWEGGQGGPPSPVLESWSPTSSVQSYEQQAPAVDEPPTLRCFVTVAAEAEMTSCAQTLW